MRKFFETCQVYNTILFIAFNSFLFLNTFSVFLKASITIFSDGLLTSRFSANKLYYVVSLSFFYIQLFLTFFIVQIFSGYRFLRVQVFQSPCFLRSRFFRVRFFWVQSLGPGFRSSRTQHRINTEKCYIFQ